MKITREHRKKGGLFVSREIKKIRKTEGQRGSLGKTKWESEFYKLT